MLGCDSFTGLNRALFLPYTVVWPASAALALLYMYNVELYISLNGNFCTFTGRRFARPTTFAWFDFNTVWVGGRDHLNPFDYILVAPVELCFGGVILRVPETKFNRRNDDIVKRVKVIAPTDPDCIEIKPRKRGRPRKAPPGECAEIAIQTDVQLNVVRVE